MKTFNIFMKIGFYIPEENRISVGGVQTYMFDLAKLSEKMGYKPVVYEINDSDKVGEYQYDGISIVQISQKGRQCFQKCFNQIYDNNTSKENLFIISTDQLTIKAPHDNVIAINHGIAFDEPIHRKFSTFFKLLKCIKNVYRAKIVNNIVCVDYNYFNWLRTLYTIPESLNISVIPNYSQGCIRLQDIEKKIKNTKRRKILFARRFVEHRGALIFAKTVIQLLEEYPDIDITFAGEGPLKQELESMFENDARIHLTRYSNSESIAFHYNYDIAVVPTIYSEGTSLSLIEAMSAGCYCIASYTGGLTNIIIDHFNGQLVKPGSLVDLYKAISESITCEKSEFDNICYNGYETSVKAFSKEKWHKSWEQYIHSINCKLSQ